MKKTCPNVTDVTCRPQEIKELHSRKPAELQASEVDMKLFIPFDVYAYDGLNDTDVNFHFMLDEPPYYPSYLCKYCTSVSCLATARAYCCVYFSGDDVTALNNYLSNNTNTNTHKMSAANEYSEENRKEGEEEQEE
jgi:hypothetical protein